MTNIRVEDAFAWLGRLKPGIANLVITDPPYASLEKHRAIGTTTRLKHSKSSSNDWRRSPSRTVRPLCWSG